MKNIYLMDRNIISIIDKFNNGRKLRKDQYEILVLLRQRDRKSNLFSPLLAIMEGQSGRPENEIEILKTINDDVEKIVKNNFFKKAKVDQSFFKINFLKNLLLESLLTSARDIKRESYISLLNHFNKTLGNTISPGKRIKAAREMKLKADELNISIGHTTFFSSLLFLFNSSRARDLLKFGKSDFSAYNVYSDIKLYNDYIKITDMLLKGKIEAKVKIISHDKGVNFLKELYSEIISTSHTKIAPQINQFEAKLLVNTKIISAEVTGDENRNNFREIYNELYNQDILI
ncbi:hypothetical protein [Pectobacterium polaris]|uniref:hypothetical protein n=1 Tax=Pectobacterium polaris TaxID=2042057 RepID=UPI002B24D5A2|nr:hypothetical protein [Pectobacterium polaris]